MPKGNRGSSSKGGGGGHQNSTTSSKPKTNAATSNKGGAGGGGQTKKRDVLASSAGSGKKSPSPLAEQQTAEGAAAVERFYQFVTETGVKDCTQLKYRQYVASLGPEVDKQIAASGEDKTRPRNDALGQDLKSRGNCFMQEVAELQRLAKSPEGLTPQLRKAKNLNNPEELKARIEELAKVGTVCYSDALYTTEIKSMVLKSQLHANRALAFIVLRQYELGFADAEAAIDLQPSFVKAYYRAATCADQIGRFEKAEELLLEGIKQEKKQSPNPPPPDAPPSDLQTLLDVIRVKRNAAKSGTHPTGAASAMKPPGALTGARSTSASTKQTAAKLRQAEQPLITGGRRPFSAEHQDAMIHLEDPIGEELPNLDNPEEFTKLSLRVAIGTVVKRYWFDYKNQAEDTVASTLPQKRGNLQSEAEEEEIKSIAEERVKDHIDRAKDSLSSIKTLAGSLLGTNKSQKKRIEKIVESVSQALKPAILAIPNIFFSPASSTEEQEAARKQQEQRFSYIPSTTVVQAAKFHEAFLDAFLIDSAFVPQNVAENCVKIQVGEMKQKTNQRKHKTVELDAQVRKEQKKLNDQQKVFEKTKKAYNEMVKKEADAKSALEEFQEAKARLVAEKEELVAGDYDAAVAQKKKLLSDIKAQAALAEEQTQEQEADMEEHILNLRERINAAKLKLRRVQAIQAAKLEELAAKKEAETARKKREAAIKREADRIESEERQEKERQELERKELETAAAMGPYVEKDGGWWVCTACDRKIPSLEGMSMHVKNTKHLDVISELEGKPLGVNRPITPPAQTKGRGGEVEPTRRRLPPGVDLASLTPPARGQSTPASQQQHENLSPSKGASPSSSTTLPASSSSPDLTGTTHPVVRVGGQVVPAPDPAKLAALSQPDMVAVANLSKLDVDARPFVPGVPVPPVPPHGVPPPTTVTQPPPGGMMNNNRHPHMTGTAGVPGFPAPPPPPGHGAPHSLPPTTSVPAPVVKLPLAPRFIRSGVIKAAEWTEELASELAAQYPGVEFDLTRPKFGSRAAFSIAAPSQTMLRTVVDALLTKPSRRNSVSTAPSLSLILDEEVYREMPTGEVDLVVQPPTAHHGGGVPPTQPLLPFGTTTTGGGVGIGLGASGADTKRVSPDQSATGYPTTSIFAQDHLGTSGGGSAQPLIPPPGPQPFLAPPANTNGLTSTSEDDAQTDWLATVLTQATGGGSSNNTDTTPSRAEDWIRGVIQDDDLF